MLRLPRLDDQNFDEIVRNSVERIPGIYKEWTDFNEHDPGITLIQLFAWLKEMQQYHLDRITPESRKKYLKLLGIKPGHCEPATANVVFQNQEEKQQQLPEGLRFFVEDIPFELVHRVTLLKEALIKYVMKDRNGYFDMTEMMQKHSMPMYAFGENPSPDNALYLGFDRDLHEDGTIRLWLEIWDEYGVKRNPFKDSRYFPREIMWEYLKEGEEGAESWVPLEVIHDTTYALSQSGELEWVVPSPMKRQTIHQQSGEYFWIRAVLKRCGCEESPKIQQIYENFGQVAQKQTVARLYEFTVSLDGEAIRLESWMAARGLHLAAVREKPEGWTILKEDEYNVELLDNCLVINPERSVFTRLIQDGRPNVRVICVDEDFSDSFYLGSSEGLPRQRFKYGITGKLIPSSLILLVGQKGHDGCLRWYDWDYVDDLGCSGPEDRHFTFDAENGEFVFGDGEMGRIPPAGEDNICIISCAVTLGADGNIKSSPVTLTEPDLSGSVAVHFLHDVKGGRDEESIEQAEQRVIRMLNRPERAVTELDYVNIAMNTPGVRIAKAKVIPLYNPDAGFYENNVEEAAVTVAVIPYSHHQRPMPDQSFLRAVARELNKHRLITTKVHVIPPIYIEISVYAEVMVNGEGIDEVIISKRLNRYISPIKIFTSKDDMYSMAGWEFGKPVCESDIISILSNIEGILAVKKVSISARGSGWKKNSSGDIIIPPQGLVYSGVHEISILEP